MCLPNQNGKCWRKQVLGSPKKRKSTTQFANHRETPPFPGSFPPHAAQGNFPTSWMEALRVKELWEPDKGENENTTSPWSQFFAPEFAAVFLPTHQPGCFFFKAFIWGDKSVVYSWLPHVAPTFLSPHVSKHKEKGPCWGGEYFGYPIWKNLQMLQFSQLKAIFVYALITDPDPSFPVMRCHWFRQY